jgi:hypothetical protein
MANTKKATIDTASQRATERVRAARGTSASAAIT